MEKTYCYEYPRPALSTDMLILRQGKEGVEVLLITRKKEPFTDKHVFPGGYFDFKDASIEATASRELKEEVGLDVEMELLGPFSAPERDPRGRSVSIAYYGWASVDAEPKAGDDAKSAAWHRLDNLPELGFDHAEMMEQLRAKLGI